MYKDRLGFQCRDESDDLRDEIARLTAAPTRDEVEVVENILKAYGVVLTVAEAPSLEMVAGQIVEELKKRRSQCQ